MEKALILVYLRTQMTSLKDQDGKKPPIQVQGKKDIERLKMKKLVKRFATMKESLVKQVIKEIRIGIAIIQTRQVATMNI